MGAIGGAPGQCTWKESEFHRALRRDGRWSVAKTMCPVDPRQG